MCLMSWLVAVVGGGGGVGLVWGLSGPYLVSAISGADVGLIWALSGLYLGLTLIWASSGAYPAAKKA